ncbi:MAG: tetratricopeptide repeat protein [Gemmataceae bacterium]|nr:tetratricopeptide repeat protein [Gemmataceae bacterium]
MQFRLPFVVLGLFLAGCATTNDERWRSINEDGVQMFGKGDYRMALHSFDYALTLRPQDPVLIYNTAQCYDRLGDVKKAEELYAYCLQRDTKHGDARLALVSLKYRTGRVTEANQQILDWLKQEPNSADVQVADAWRLRQEKAYPLAQSRLQHARSLDPHNRRVLTEMAVLCEIQGMPERSLVLYEEILAREPNQVEIADRAAQLKARGVKAPLPN